MIDLIIENLFSVLVDMSVEKIVDLKKQYTNQRILYLTACQYVNTDFFKTEYRDVTAIVDAYFGRTEHRFL